MLITCDTHTHISLTGLIQRTLPDGSAHAFWAMGYFFDSGGRLWYGDEIIDWLARELGDRPLAALLPRMNGCFSIIMVSPEERKIEVGIDRLGVIPVYCRSTSGGLALSDQFWSLVSPGAQQYDPLALVGMFLLGHAAGTHTLLEDVRILAPACVHTFTWQANGIRGDKQVYYQTSYHPDPFSNYEELRAETAAMLRRVFQRYAFAIAERNWSANIPLSGGLDSRLLLGMLHEDGLPLTAFTYGPPGNTESQVAGQLAQALNLQLANTEITGPGILTGDLLRDLTHRIGMRARFTTGFGPQLALSGYDPARVFLTGHPANQSTGQAPQRGTAMLRNTRQLAQHYLNNYGVPVPDALAARLMPAIWDESIKYRIFEDGQPFNPQDPIGSYEGWTWYFHDNNLILQEMRTYERFGNWLLPYVDYELVEFYQRIPQQFRFRRRLHVDAVLTHLFTGKLSALAEIPIADKGRLRPPEYDWRDHLLLHLPRTRVGDLILNRHTRSVQRNWAAGLSTQAQRAWGPDPFDYWWYHNPEFKAWALDTLDGWDGMGGLVDTTAMRAILDSPMHPLFIRFGLATLLTLRSFQQQAEQRAGEKAPRSDAHA